MGFLPSPILAPCLLTHGRNSDAVFLAHLTKKKPSLDVLLAPRRETDRTNPGEFGRLDIRQKLVNVLCA